MHPVTALSLLSHDQTEHLKTTVFSLLSREQREHRKTLPTAGSTFQAPKDPRLKRLPAVPSSAPDAIERQLNPLAKPKREARHHEIVVTCFDINHPLAVCQLQGEFKHRLDCAAMVKALNDKSPSKQSTQFLINYNTHAKLDTSSAASSADSLASSI